MAPAVVTSTRTSSRAPTPARASQRVCANLGGLTANPGRRHLTAAELGTTTGIGVGGSTLGADLTPVGVIAVSLLVEGQLSLGMAGQHPGALIGHFIGAERVHVFGRFEQGIHKALKPLVGDHDRPGDAFLIAVHLTAQHPAHHLLHHAVVAVAAIEALAEFAGEQQAAHELPHADIAVAQLHLEHRLAIHLEGVEEDLAVGLFDLLIHAHLGTWSFVAADGEVVHPGVLGDGPGGQQRQCHGMGRNRSRTYGFPVRLPCEAANNSHSFTMP